MLGFVTETRMTTSISSEAQKHLKVLENKQNFGFYGHLELYSSFASKQGRKENSLEKKLIYGQG